MFASFFLHYFFKLQKGMAYLDWPVRFRTKQDRLKLDGLELISFAVLSNIYCKGIGLPIGGFKDQIYSA